MFIFSLLFWLFPSFFCKLCCFMEIKRFTGCFLCRLREKIVKWWWCGRAARENGFKENWMCNSFLQTDILTLCAANIFRPDWIECLFSNNSRFIILLLHSFLCNVRFFSWASEKHNAIHWGSDYSPLNSLVRKFFHVWHQMELHFNFVCLHFLLMENKTCHPFLNALNERVGSFWFIMTKICL